MKTFQSFLIILLLIVFFVNFGMVMSCFSFLGCGPNKLKVTEDACFNTTIKECPEGIKIKNNCEKMAIIKNTNLGNINLERGESIFLTYKDIPELGPVHSPEDFNINELLSDWFPVYDEPEEIKWDLVAEIENRTVSIKGEEKPGQLSMDCYNFKNLLLLDKLIALALIPIILIWALWKLVI